MPPSAIRTAGMRRAVGRRSARASRLLVHLDRRIDRARHRCWDVAADTLAAAAPAHITVDVFDTVLTRRVAGDEALWWVTATALRAQGAWTRSAHEFVVARRAAARADRAGSLQSLYQGPALSAGLTCSTAADVESDVETELAVAVPGAARGLARLRDAGHRITFVSDMHLAPNALWSSLVEHGLAVEGDGLVVSSAVGASKSAGTLFPRMSRTGDAPSWHVGNDLWGDVAMAERSGVGAFPVRIGESTELERTMSRGGGSVGSAIAAAARQVRSSTGSLAVEDAALVEAGADVAGQCLTAFLLWARAECELAGVRQVMFLARDGELPLRMAQAMPADYWEGVQLGYLQGSRRLWSVAAAGVIGVEAWLRAGTEDDRGFLRQNQHLIPWSSLLARAALDRRDLDGHPLLAALSPDEPLPVHLDSAWRELLADEHVQERIESRAAVQLDDLQQVLRSSGLDAGRAALVDVGWRGQLAWQVSAVLREVTGHEPVHLHFGGVEVAEDDHGADIRRFAVDDRKAPLPFPDVISCVETFTASGAARARTTQRDDDGRVQLLYDPALPQMQTEQRRLLRQSAVDVAAQLPSRQALTRWGLHEQGLDERVRQVLTTFWTSPTWRHAKAAAQLAAEIDDAGINVHPVATPYVVSELRGGRGAARTWRQASLRLTRQPLRVVIALALRVKDARTTG